MRPAIRWAAAVWVRIEGGAGPPLTPSVWLQGDPGAWRPRDEHHVHLWHALRVAVLSAAWALRCRRAARGTQFTPADVAAACVEDLRAIVRAEWRRSQSGPGAGHGVPPRTALGGVGLASLIRVRVSHLLLAAFRLSLACTGPIARAPAVFGGGAGGYPPMAAAAGGEPPGGAKSPPRRRGPGGRVPSIRPPLWPGAGAASRSAGFGLAVCVSRAELPPHRAPQACAGPRGPLSGGLGGVGWGRAGGSPAMGSHLVA